MIVEITPRKDKGKEEETWTEVEKITFLKWIIILILCLILIYLLFPRNELIDKHVFPKRVLKIPV